MARPTRRARDPPGAIDLSRADDEDECGEQHRQPREVKRAQHPRPGRGLLLARLRLGTEQEGGQDKEWQAAPGRSPSREELDHHATNDQS